MLPRLQGFLLSSQACWSLSAGSWLAKGVFLPFIWAMRMVWFQFLVLHLFKQFRKRLVRWPLPGKEGKAKE